MQMLGLQVVTRRKKRATIPDRAQPCPDNEVNREFRTLEHSRIGLQKRFQTQVIQAVSIYSPAIFRRMSVGYFPPGRRRDMMRAERRSAEMPVPWQMESKNQARHRMRAALGARMARAFIKVFLLVSTAAFGLSACQSGSNPFVKKDNTGEAGADVSSETSVRLVDRDVEAPQVFQVNDDALWDGRPSLGGVWVASPDAKDPERVILRNPSNGKFVIGALFRRERINPGPKLQISSDAAAALGMLAGAPAKINVTALRREEAKAETPDAARPILDANEAVQTSSLDPISTASAALDKVEGNKPVAAAEPAAPVAASTAVRAGGTALIQIGIFSVEANATRASATLTKSGIPASVTKDSSQGKEFWRVTAGPTAANARDATLSKVKGLGFTDAYFVSR